MIKAILFDLDGVLIDAVHTHFEAFNRAIQLFGYEVPKTLHGLNYNGLPTSSKLEMLTQAGGLPRSLHPFINEMKQSYTRELIAKKAVPSLPLTQLLGELKKRGLKLAVASNCVRSTVDLVLKKMDIAGYFDVILSREEVQAPKPDPALYRRCLELLALKPNECLIIEDSKPGILAAQRTSPNVVVLKNPNQLSLKLIEEKMADFEALPAQMEQVIEIVIPMAGLGSRFAEAGYQDPKPLIPVLGKPMIQWVVENLSSQKYRTHFTFIVNRQHSETYRLTEKLSLIAPGCSVVAIPGKTEGAACTVLHALDEIAVDRPLVIANSDQYVDFDFDEFLDSALAQQKDGLILTFPAQDPKWSYAKTDSAGRVVSVAEKKPISPHATVGIYFFRRALDYVTATEKMIRKEKRTNGEFYVCPVYNELVEVGAKVGIFEIPSAAMHGLGTPEDLRAFLDRSISLSNDEPCSKISVSM